jgi:hypothetical protein
MLENCLIVSEDPYFVNVGTDTSTCGAVLQIMNEPPTTESEIEIIKSSHEFDICEFKTNFRHLQLYFRILYFYYIVIVMLYHI